MEIVSLEKAKSINIVSILKGGGLIISPSDTVYGLLVDARREKAVAKLIQFKNRPWGKPISVFVSNFEMMKRFVTTNNQQTKLLNELLPGPFTVILGSKNKVSKLLESEKGTLGVRLPDYEFIIDLVKKFGSPLTATSANLSGRSPHYSVETLLKELPESKKKLIDLVIDAGKLPRNKPSTIIDLTTPQIKIVRHGDVVFKESKTYISESLSQTNKIAQYFLRKLLKEKADRPLVFIIQGDLGVGKTIFVKGVGEILGVKNIISPTYVIYYEYKIVKSHPAGGLFMKLVHVDLYNIQDPEEFKYLHLEKYLKKGNILCIEWGEKAGEIMETLKCKAKIVFVDMKYISEKKREITIRN